jgi:hypothetical protein
MFGHDASWHPPTSPGAMLAERLQRDATDGNLAANDLYPISSVVVNLRNASRFNQAESVTTQVAAALERIRDFLRASDYHGCYPSCRGSGWKQFHQPQFSAYRQLGFAAGHEVTEHAHDATTTNERFESIYRAAQACDGPYLDSS